MAGGNYLIPLESGLFFILFILYVVLGGYLEHIRAKFGHETGVALVLGLTISGLIHLITSGTLDIPFNGTVLFYVCLPPIIFASGFNMRRKSFF